MCFFFSFVPATFWAVVGYFVLFSSRKAEGNIRKLGQVLAVWVFVLAVMLPIVGAYFTIAELCPIDAILDAQD